ncbi:hypothetical protein G6F42_018483 [Rhizopus arrhizus]|nr:hypothetical protein G6F42_018483 [Rhizopus arrhizus]
MSSLYYSKLPLPPANYDNNNNVICKPWQLPTLFEKSLTLQDHIASDRAYRHIAFEPKNKLAYNNTTHLKHELESVHGDIKAIRFNVGADNATVVSFFSILHAKHCYDALKQKWGSCYSMCFVKSTFFNKTNSSEKLFVIFSSINSRADLLNYDYMKHILRFGSIYSISEARISRSCILVNVEYHDERHGEALKANLNCSFIEVSQPDADPCPCFVSLTSVYNVQHEQGAQIMVYNASSNDEISCAQHDTKRPASAVNRPSSLSIDTKTSIASVRTPPVQKIMVATPLPSPVAEGDPYFTVDPYSASKYHHISSLPPSPVALQHETMSKPNGLIDTLPSSSSNTTFSTCIRNQEENVSYAAAVQSTCTNTTTTTDSSSNPTPTPSPTHSNETVQTKKLEEKASSPPSRNSSRRKRPATTTKKAVSNCVDFERIRSGQDKRTTFMIRNIPNKYTQVSS